MNVGIPGEDRDPLPLHPGKGQAVKWLLAAVGAVFAYLFVQIVAAVVVGVALLTTDVDTLMFAATAGNLTLAVLWWLHLRPRALMRCGEERPSRPARIALLACVLFALGLVLQVTLSCVLTLVLPLFPEVMDAYLELMELAGISGEMDIATFVEAAVVAPIAEEAICRGVMLEFCLRAVCPELQGIWLQRGDGERPAARPKVSSRRFWVANAIQALLFAIMHLNVVQGVYAFALGMLLGWIVRRTGGLRAAILLHMAVNGASAFMDVLDPLLGGAFVPVLLVGGVLSAVLVWAVARLTDEGPSEDGMTGGGPAEEGPAKELPAGERP